MSITDQLPDDDDFDLIDLEFFGDDLTAANGPPIAVAPPPRPRRPQTPTTVLEGDLRSVSLASVLHLAESDAIDGVLKAGPKTTPAIRKALPDGAIRNLGEKGKKAGVSSPLPVALRELEFAGRIERIPVGARLDTEKYEWRRAKPAKRASAGRDFAERVQLVARRFFEWFGPATLKELTAWSGLTARDAKAAVAALPLVPVAIEGHADDAWALEADRDALVDASPTASFDFLAFEDNLLIIHGGPGAHADAAYHDRPLASWGMQKPTTLGAAKHIAWRTILFKGEIIGYWEYDLDKGELVHALFDGPPKGQKRALAQRSEELAAFLRDDLGHARSFSLDTDEAIRARVAGLRAML